MNGKITGLTRKCPLCKSIDVEQIIGTSNFYGCHNCRATFEWKEEKEEIFVNPNSPTTEFPSGAKRNLEGLRMDLVCPQSIIALASASAQGVPKYGARNWEKGIPTAILIGKAIIHLCRFRLKQIDGEEDLYEHLEHALWNIHAALHNVKCGKPHGEDDKI